MPARSLLWRLHLSPDRAGITRGDAAPSRESRGTHFNCVASRSESDAVAFSGDKMGSGKDKKPRKRRTMKPGERVQRAKKRHGTESIANIFSTAPGSNVDEDDMDVDEQPANQSRDNDGSGMMDDDDELLSNDSGASDNEEKPSSNRVINDQGFSLRAVGVLNPSPIEPSIDDEGDWHRPRRRWS